MNNNIIFDVKKESGLPISTLKGLLKKWQKKLRMDDWTFELKIVNFNRPDFKQSGDFIADTEKKNAVILLTSTPWRGDEEYTLLHEMIHVLLYDYDKYCEYSLLLSYQNQGKEHDIYMEKLENTVHQLTQILLKKEEPKG